MRFSLSPGGIRLPLRIGAGSEVHDGKPVIRSTCRNLPWEYIRSKILDSS
jgi:hypothetical protein